jgi:hypothetical protein
MLDINELCRSPYEAEYLTLVVAEDLFAPALDGRVYPPANAAARNLARMIRTNRRRLACR